ncbi:MAG: hypothetical protein JOZ41_15835, partial [Chloroflexi bacterium]|nr:hypothetical protein [Chloroflexota bacterium]
MSQLWWTSSGGYYGVRAASTGLADDARFRRLEPFVKYALPANASLHRVTPASAPRTLALIAAGEERVLVNKVFVGKDDVGRAGIVFSHLVADLPEDFLAGDAIQLWRSDFWRKSDGTLPAAERTLPPVPRQDLGARGPLDEAELRNRLQDDNLRSSLEFVIQAVLGGDVGRRIYIAAPCDDVALLILGLTLCLPRRLQTALTFSTYESDVSIAFTRLVGTCQPLPHEALVPGPFDLPAACYRAGYAVNCYAPTPKMSSLGSEERAFEAFARFAADQLAGDPSSLRELLCIAEEDEIDRPRDLLALARLWLATRADSGERSDILGGERQGETGRAPTRGAPKGADRIDSTSMAAALTVSEENLGLILGSRTLARELLPLDEVQEALVAMLASGSAWWAGRGRDGLAKLTRDRAFDPVRRQIARRALERATMELQRDGVERAQRLIEELAGFDQPVGSRAWASLLLDLTRLCGDHAPSAYYDWRIYTFVLERCARDPFCSQDDAAAQALSRWLAVGWQGIPRFLGLELPRELVARCLTQALLRPDAVPAAIGPLVDEHAEEFSAALASALREPGGDEAVRRFFDALRGQRCRSRALLMAGLPSDVYGDQHPPSGASRSRAATMAGRSTAIPAGGAPLVGALAPSRSEALLTIRRFCRSPQLGKDELRELALGLRVLAPDGDALQRQRAALLPVLIATARDKREIEDVLETLGEVLMGSPLALLRVILYGLDSSELADPGVAAPYLEVALDDRARCWHIPWATAFEDRARLVRPLLTAT